MTIFFMIFFLRAFRRNTRLRRRLFRTSAIAPFLRLRYGTPAAVLHSLTHFIKRISLSQEKTQTETKIPRFSKTTACAFRLKPFPDSAFPWAFFLHSVAVTISAAVYNHMRFSAFSLIEKSWNKVSVLQDFFVAHGTPAHDSGFCKRIAVWAAVHVAQLVVRFSRLSKNFRDDVLSGKKRTFAQRTIHKTFHAVFFRFFLGRWRNNKPSGIKQRKNYHDNGGRAEKQFHLRRNYTAFLGKRNSSASWKKADAPYFSSKTQAEATDCCSENSFSEDLCSSPSACLANIRLQAFPCRIPNAPS